jgi:hypothetical protein
LVLTAPHGGNETDGEQQTAFTPRPDLPGVSVLQDVGTAALLEEIDRRVMSKTGQVQSNWFILPLLNANMSERHCT